MKTITALVGAVASLLALASAASFSNPLKPTNGSDPHIAYSGGYYYLMTTTWTNLQITRAKTLEGLKNGETRIAWTDKPHRAVVMCGLLNCIRSTTSQSLPCSLLRFCYQARETESRTQVVHLLHRGYQHQPGWPASACLER